MNAENFSEYLKNPSQLYQVSYQELKSLVLQYPYSPNLRYLLMRKAKMENNEDYDRLLSMASAYSIDRNFLFKKMKADRLIPEFEENYELNEEYLELKDLDALEVEAELVEQSANPMPDELAFALDGLEDKPQEVVVPSPSISKKEDDMAEDSAGSLLERLLDGDFTDIDGAVEHEVMNNLTLEDISKASHSSDNDAVEERIIEHSLAELSEKADLIQQFEVGSKEVISEKSLIAAFFPKSDIEKAIEADIEAQMQEEKVPVFADSESDIDLEEEGQILEQERFPDLQLSSLETIDWTTKIDELDDLEEVVVGEEASVLEGFPAKNLVIDDDFDEKIVEPEKEEDADDIEDMAVSLNDLKAKKVEESPIASMLGRPKPLPKSSFNSWLQQYKAPLLDTKIDEIKEDLDKKSKKKKGKKKDMDALVVAKASVAEDNEIATETLASLLEKQGHYGRAIRMYETLRLRNPEKSAFFAAKIEALQQLRDEE